MSPLDLAPLAFLAGLQEATMRTFDLNQLYRLGRSLGDLGRLKPEDKLTKAVAGCLAEARFCLTAQSMTQPELAAAIGDAWGALRGVLDEVKNDVDARIAPGSGEFDEGVPLGATARWLSYAIEEFGNAWRRGVERLYVVVVTDVRLYDSRKLMLNGDRVLDPEVRRVVLPIALDEIKTATRCLGLDLWTAAGFHSLRAIEAVLRTYYAVLPIEDADTRSWDRHIGRLKTHGVDEKLCSRLNDLRYYDRNPLMHSENTLDRGKALDLFQYATTVIAEMARDIAARAAARTP